MKDFIIYVQPRRREKTIVGKEHSLDELGEFPGSSRIEELNFVKNGRLKIVQESKPYRVFQFSCVYLKRMVAATKLVSADLSFDLWQRKGTSIIATIEGPKKASYVAVALLSVVVFGDPFAISPVRLTVQDYQKLKENILEKHSGNLTQIMLKNVRSRKGTIRRFLMTGSALEQFVDIDGLLNDSSEVSGMGFAIPSFAGGRRLSFRIKNWGGGQIYSPANPFDHEISGLLELFERILFSNNSDTNL